MASSTCTSKHIDVPASALEQLSSSQKGKWRHTCAACAYELGRKHVQETEERLRKRISELENQLRQQHDGSPAR